MADLNVPDIIESEDDEAMERFISHAGEMISMGSRADPLPGAKILNKFLQANSSEEM